MIVTVKMTMQFNNDLPLHEVEGIMNNGEYFPNNVLDCEVKFHE